MEGIKTHTPKPTCGESTWQNETIITGVRSVCLAALNVLVVMSVQRGSPARNEIHPNQKRASRPIAELSQRKEPTGDPPPHTASVIQRHSPSVIQNQNYCDQTSKSTWGPNTETNLLTYTRLHCNCDVTPRARTSVIKHETKPRVDPAPTLYTQ